MIRTIISISLVFLLLCDSAILLEIPGCGSSFACRGLGILGPPFFNGMLNDCGLIELDCYEGKIKLSKDESQWYHVRNLGATRYNYYSNIDDNTFEIRDSLLEEKLKSRSCESFKNITLPTSPDISYSLCNKKKTFVRCTGNSSQITAQYFSGYFNYTSCSGFSLYYMDPDYDKALLTTMPPTCSVIQLPMELGENQLDHRNTLVISDPFQDITATICVRWYIMGKCSQCYYNGGICSTNTTRKHEFQCIQGDLQIPLPGTRNRLRTTLVIGSASAATIVILLVIVFSFGKKIAMIWRRKTDLYRSILAFGRNLNIFALSYSDIKKIVLRWTKKTKRFRYSDIKKTVMKWRKKTKSRRATKTFLKNYGSLTPKRYKYSDVKKMTISFRDKLGEGGYGSVYKGKLFNGNLVAVKVLKESKGGGEEFFNEVASISRTSHVNVVTLLGFCLNGRNRALIYEYMPNGSLEKFVYNKISSTNHQLGWDIYYKIAVGIARGLEYLHRGCNTRILHFDIKPHNILLDEDFIPKIADFGLAKLCPGKESVVSMMNPRGTIGYIAPEVLSKEFGQVSHKSDVYSYGMMILEMVGWRKNIEDQVSGDTSEMYFPDWIYKRLESDKQVGMKEIINKDENIYERKMIIASLWCIQSDPLNRPSMSKIVDMLEGNLESLQIPPKPILSSPSLSPLTNYSSTIEIG